MSREVITRHYTRLISLWPRDPLRPISFHSALQHRLSLWAPPSDQAPAQQNDSKPQTGSALDKSDTKVVKGLEEFDAKIELVKINALYSLLEDRYSKRYPLNEQYLRPASNPDHYTNLIAEMETAPTRNWWDRFLNKWKGFVRMK